MNARIIRLVTVSIVLGSTSLLVLAQKRSDPGLTPAQLSERALARRAIEAVSWGMPAVNYDLMLQAIARDAKGAPGSNQIVFWSRLPDWKNQTLTPNPDVIYVMPFFDTKDTGPMVLEIPPADEGVINGTIMDCWQMPLEDVGPAGVDKGKGGRYLILPPDFKGKAPEGYVALPSATFQGYGLLRSILAGGSEADVAKAVRYAKRINFYPLSQAAHPPQAAFVDAVDVVFDSTIPYDARFFESLHRMVQNEVWLPRDKVMIDVLRSIGIEKGKPFNPGPGARETLNEAAREAHAALEIGYEGLFTPFADGARWALPALPEFIQATTSGYAAADAYPIDARGLVFSFAFFTPKHLGEGQFYLMTIKDKAGKDFDGARTYRLSVPKNVPARQYWSATVYDRMTHAFIRGLPRANRSSQSPDLKKNADGSVDVYFGQKAPEGKEGNWVPTNADGRFEVLFRLYGPEKALFEKTWRLPDIEVVN